MPSTADATFSNYVSTQLQRAVAHSVAPRRLWIDCGISTESIANNDVHRDASLVLVGVDAVNANLRSRRHAATPRLARIGGACAETAGVGIAAFETHNSPTCGSLLPSSGMKIGKGKDACIGDMPVTVPVISFPLQMLIHLATTMITPRVELLLIDIQGAELPCLRSAASSLRLVDHIFLEVQDLLPDESGSHLYNGSASLPQLDALLEGQGFERQYCEPNAWIPRFLHEVNCLYSSRSAARPIWVTANGRLIGGARNRSIVSYDARPVFPGGEIWRAGMRSSNFSGARAAPAARNTTGRKRRRGKIHVEQP